MGKITAEEEKHLGIVPARWDDLCKDYIVYIRAADDAPLYGPYKVVDVVNREVANLDGSRCSRYPRNYGLYVSHERDLLDSYGLLMSGMDDKEEVKYDSSFKVAFDAKLEELIRLYQDLSQQRHMLENKLCGIEDEMVLLQSHIRLLEEIEQCS